MPTGTQIKPSDAEVGVELDRLLLCIYENPSLLAYLQGVSRIGNVAELSFLELPAEAVEQVVRMIGPTEVKVFSYTEQGKPRTAYRFDLLPLAQLNSQIQ